MFDKALLGLPGMRKVFLALVASSLVQSALVIAQMLALAGALSSLWAREPIESQAPLLAAFLACFAVRYVVSYIQDEALDRFSVKTALALRDKVMHTTFSERAGLSHRMGTAATASAATEGIDDIARYVRVLPPKLCGLIGFSIPILASLFFVDWVSGAICLVALPVTVLFMVVLGKQARTRSEKQYAENQRLSNHFIDTLRGVETVHALDAGKHVGEAIYESSERLRTTTVRTLSVATLSSAVLDLIAVFGIAGVAMMLAFRLMDGSIALETALAALMIAPEFFGSIRSFSSDFHASLDGKNALAAVLEIAEAGAESTGPNRLEPPAPWSERSSLYVRDLAFSYDDAKAALQGVSFDVRGFSRVGIVGPSGAGKSTLVNILAGFATPCAGCISINDTPASFEAETWKSQLHYIPQFPHLFNATLMDNIRFYAPHSSREEVERAVDLAGLGKTVSRLPEGLDTVIGEGGRTLSGGEAQRVALARILVDERPVLLFDEPTAHLDIETELEMKRKMLSCMEGKLVFFATHRMHWLRDMDYVLVIDGGFIVESGNPRDLLARDSVLRRLALSDGEVAA